MLILAGTVAAAAFHELGHAVALHYGGGTPRAMGAGLYLVYPAFYTDVSDNYRLGRWARVRTDLGGFYFNLLFAIGTLGLYALTGQEVLLLIVSLLNFEVLRQLAPLMRLDGYWTLADLTGVPDFLSHMGAYLRSRLPGQQAAERRFPRLKWWANAVFLAYVLIAVPLMVLQVVLMLRGVPRVLATAWDSTRLQLGAIEHAQSGGDTTGMLLGCLQLVALLLPTLAVLIGLSRFLRMGLGGLWRWSGREPSLARRVVAGVGMLALAGFLVYAWLPRGRTATDGTPLTVSGQAAYAPIGPNERGTLGDVVAGVVATSAPRAGSSTTPTPDAAQTRTPVPTLSSERGVTDLSPVSTATPASATRAPALVATRPPNAATTPPPATAAPTAAPGPRTSNVTPVPER